MPWGKLTNRLVNLLRSKFVCLELESNVYNLRRFALALKSGCSQANWYQYQLIRTPSKSHKPQPGNRLVPLSGSTLNCADDPGNESNRHAGSGESSFRRVVRDGTPHRSVLID